MRSGTLGRKETEEDLDGVAHNSMDLDETQEHVEKNCMMMLVLVLMRLCGVMEVQRC